VVGQLLPPKEIETMMDAVIKNVTETHNKQFGGDIEALVKSTLEPYCTAMLGVSKE
jgi:anaerobic ribonucleoside-triphosphate reductase